MSDSVVRTAGERTFLRVLVNTAVANLTTSFLWFALTFWAYLETRSVLATGVIGGAYMLFVAVCSIPFGTLVDRHRKHRVMVGSSAFTLVAFVVAGVLWLLFPERVLVDLGQPWFWLFAGIVLAGAVVENMRNVALSTTVTLLVPVERHANANGLVGAVGGIAFIVTSVFSGLAVGLLGMGWTLLISLVLTAVALVHLMTLRIPEDEPGVLPAEAGAEAGADAGIPAPTTGEPTVAATVEPTADPAPEPVPRVDLRGSFAAVRAVPGLMALIIFSTFNNLIGGVYMALMDPYGLTLFPVELWGIFFGLASTGFIIGGVIVASRGLGRNPARTMLLGVIVMGALGALFTIREWAWLYLVGIWLYMLLIPAIEAAEQTIIQKVVPYRKQGRVFGFAMAFEASAAPITAFLIAPIAEFWIIPYMDGEGAQTWDWLLGQGEARGIAFVFLVAGVVMMIAAALAFTTRSYRRLSDTFAGEADSVPAADLPGSPVPQ